MYSEEDYYEFDEEEIYKIPKKISQIENITFDERTLEEELETSEAVPSSTFGPLLQWTIVLGAFIVQAFQEAEKVTKNHENNKSENDFYVDVGGCWKKVIMVQGYWRTTW